MHRSARYIAHRIVAPLACALLFLLILIVPNVWADSSSAAKADQISRGEEATVDPHHDGDKKSGDADKTDKSHEGKKTDEDKKADKGNKGDKGEKADKDKKADKSDKSKKTDEGKKADKDKRSDKSDKSKKADGDASAAPVPAPRDPAQRDTSGSSGVAAGRIFTSYITVGENDHVPCTFQVSEDGQALLGGGTDPAIDAGLTGKVFIPATVIDSAWGDASYSIKQINKRAFDGCSITSTGLLSYKNPGGATITSIGEDAYRGCANLTDTDLKDSMVEEIGAYAFSESGITTTGLARDTRITKLPDYIFNNCRNLEKTDLELSAVQLLGNYAFAGCTSLKNTGLANNEVLINKDPEEDDKTKIATGCFAACAALQDTGLAHNDMLKVIPDHAFANCYRLSSTGLASNTTITDIGPSAFYTCCDKDAKTGLKKTGLENNSTVINIGDTAFAYDKLLESTGLENPDCAVTTVGEYAFQFCSGLSSTGLENNSKVETLGRWAFGNSGVKSTGLGNHTTGVTELESNVFYGCGKLTATGLETNSAITTIKTSAFAKCICLTSTGLETNNTVKTIGDSAFSDCFDTTNKRGLTSTGLATNKTVEKIGKQAFYNDPYLGSEGNADENKGDLVLNGCEGKLSIGDQAFSAASAANESAYKAVYILCEKEKLKIGKKAFDYFNTTLSRKYIPSLYVQGSWEGTESYIFGRKDPNKSDNDESIYEVTPHTKKAEKLIIMNPLCGMAAERTANTSKALLSYSYNRSGNVKLSDTGGDDLGSFVAEPGPKPDLANHDIDPEDTGVTVDPHSFFCATVIEATFTDPDGWPITYPKKTSDGKGVSPHPYNAVGNEDDNYTTLTRKCNLDPVTFNVTFDGNGGRSRDGKDTVTKTRVSYGGTTFHDLVGDFKRENYEFLAWAKSADEHWYADDKVEVCNIQDGSVTLKARWKSEAAVGLRVLSKKKDSTDPLGGVSYVITDSEDSDESHYVTDLYTNEDETKKVDWPLTSGGDGLITTYWLKPLDIKAGESEDDARTYYLHVVGVPAGYDAPSEPTVIVVSSAGVTVNGATPSIEGDAVKVTISYGKAPDLPGTGWFTGVGAAALTEAGASIAVLSIFAATMWLMRRNGTC
ncbi:hypothetical protein Corgl_0467 [Coriobacterium glomerans PW2]|uniref:Uncharacterized protein n=1 Tax=Coriobacterium glomerans (strain ATCC 49209 / DSM 20642 / JCM 10262 / PW2) TaxID=700015 RepID=F2N7B0_CORGP|nr:leucine-rich repeat domain-containing protein [Coriobacterium glomerans]AEB06585.1 hypothetical protein Corgl_0467 [Coriobacterium glomerans PW2]